MSSISAASQRNTKAIAFLRICVGLLFLTFAQYKVFGTEFTLGGGFQFWINRFISDDVPPVLSSTMIWSPIPPDQEIGREEAIYRRADHRISARG